MLTRSPTALAVPHDRDPTDRSRPAAPHPHTRATPYRPGRKANNTPTPNSTAE
jgi:hypothetical protein